MFWISAHLQQYALLFCADLSMTLESIPEDLSAAGENNGEYLKMAKKGGRKGTCCAI